MNYDQDINFLLNYTIYSASDNNLSRMSLLFSRRDKRTRLRKSLTSNPTTIVSSLGVWTIQSI